MNALATFQKSAFADADVLRYRVGRKGATLSRRMGGGEARALTLWMHNSTGGACIYCGGDTNVYGEVSHPLTATLTTLIPCVMLSEDTGDAAMGADRLGYVAGNVAIAHVGCVTRARDYGVANGEPVVLTADSVDPDLVPMTWPAARKARSASQDTEAEMALSVARARAGWPF
jgi:hypothetical protein